LQQGQGVALAGQPFQKSLIKAGNVRFNLFDMSHQLVEERSNGSRSIRPARRRTVLYGGLESLAGQFQYFMWRPLGSDGPDHGPCRLAMQVADHHAKANATISEHFVQTILLRR